MKTPLKMGLLAFFALCASALSAQSWQVAFEDDELEISVSQVVCDNIPYLVFQLDNKTDYHQITKFSVKYANGGVSVDEVKEGYTVPPSETVTADCMFIENFMEMMYVQLPRSHTADLSSVQIDRL